jgi:UDP:flavonoid glycosyltransferase YjiC (YdhE family)
VARFLLIPHAPTTGLAHLGACLAVARELRSRGHDPILGYGGHRPELIEREGLQWRVVPEVPAEREWRPDAWFETRDELSAAVDGHLALIEELSPAAAVTSSGVAGRLACEVAGVPSLHLMHYLGKTPFGRGPVVWDNRRRDLTHPRRLWRVLRARGRAFGARGRPAPLLDAIAAFRAERGLPPSHDHAVAGCHDTVTALTTTPTLDPARGLPESWRYIGPVLWSAAQDESVPAGDGRPVVYITQGSTGDADNLRRAVSEVSQLGVRVLVATGGLCDANELATLGGNVFARDLLPGRRCLEVADAAVIHGGHVTFCEALRAGTPLVLFPHPRRRDQIGRVHRAERLGVGIGLYPPPLLRGGVGRAVARVLRNDRYRRRCTELAGDLRERWDGSRNAAELAESLAAGRRAPDPVAAGR